ncbi:hypothetical protein CO057_03415 [Candidatus Uhrbacteria bacterium CG_4_9_14_0_2_um_filter_41_50]|uniref:O-antigen ligase-related domain-containing protein n=1 Tax=Candidatus Uhrbacteria bacterium CG_4_9_14_0_2_um_filter_41_50 TaxID=1975031 RepID=A0A2M8ENP7_9BACT|nr:MAG: hypothetical protein COZ45_02425 [Candidatus Uhrbacteria bacterium CG_4_10_14_3_um_filter_41_21]PIZ54250.1 MAG: hypothetical protein COY24_04540 [Candidatus Uhrbacteria bacterium CG_4_10_14_0_2_um_filter_41_21]PJB84419.1 MAG: hypothetical protein CO086_03625 [Candidatus Uhrbacteria bacterium CG_4_9_14_0_8_um_filter_41_16]PJC24348.1 MAG: hypothetical protein CO057_03415 [Candidatus Uhrbacteria bacterium CG_4_9_14_0_2_um_filter_41_50]PJE75289.1 MAG: hypothetical protein COV03_00790 [Candi
MMTNLRSTYRQSDEYTRIALVVLFCVMAGAMVASVFFSPQIVMALVLSVVILFLSFLRPTWTLGFLLLYLPFEPFLLKWISDDIYIFAKYGSELLIYVLAGSVIWKRISGQIKLKSTPIDIIFFIFILLAITSALVNWIPVTYAILGIRQIIRFILLFFITFYLSPNNKWIRNVIFALFGVLAIQVVLGYGQFIFGRSFDSFLLPSESRIAGDIQVSTGVTEFWDPGQRIFGTMGRYDQLGTFMAFIMLILVSLLYEPRLTKYRKYFAALLITSIPALAMTYSRSSWFGFVLGFLFISVWAKRDRRVMWAVGAVGVVILIYLAFSGLVINQLVEVSDQNIAERFFEAFSYRRWMSEYYGLGRMYWIVQSLISVIPSAFVFGHGPAMYGGGAAAALGNSQVYDSLGLPFGVYGSGGYVDNNWLSLWGEIGSLGFVVYLWMYATLFLICLRVWRSSKSTFTRALSLGVAATMMAVALNAFLATFLEVRTLAPYLWTMTGLVVLLADRENIDISNANNSR